MKHSSAYQDGHDAGMRLGQYEGYKTCPKNPHEFGTKEWQDWYLGFDYATEELWYGDVLDEGDEE